MPGFPVAVHAAPTDEVALVAGVVTILDIDFRGGDAMCPTCGCSAMSLGSRCTLGVADVLRPCRTLCTRCGKDVPIVDGESLTGYLPMLVQATMEGAGAGDCLAGRFVAQVRGSALADLLHWAYRNQSVSRGCRAVRDELKRAGHVAV